MPSESNADDFSTRVTSPALSDPIDYTLVWKSNDGSEGTLKGCSFFWLLQPPEVYKPISPCEYYRVRSTRLPQRGMQGRGLFAFFRFMVFRERGSYVPKGRLGSPFNGSATCAIGIMNIAPCKIGQQGYVKPGIGIRNDCASSNFYLDSTTQYEFVAAEYLGDGKNIFGELPVELYGEEGPTAPKGNNNWVDESRKRLVLWLSL
ncbi:hypothetical protein V6N13_068690 [Hibiscus sabdariffa]